MEAFFISDLHLGHKNILKFSREYRGGDTIDEHDEWLVEQWNSVVRAHDTVYVLGDVAFDPDKLLLIPAMNGTKKLLMGNHDPYPLTRYLSVFKEVLPGLTKYREFWLSHCPIHSAELRGKQNIHGHVHHNSIARSIPQEIDGEIVWEVGPDERYLNVCVETLQGKPISLTELREGRFPTPNPIPSTDTR